LARILFFVGLLAIIVFMMLAFPALAQTESVEEIGLTPQISYFDFFVRKGGPIAFGLIILSVVTIALTIEHCLSIRRVTIIPPEAAHHIKAMLDENKYVEAIQFTAQDPSMLGYVVNAGLLEASNGFAAMERALEDVLEERAARLFRKTEYLSIIGNVSPMIGLLGTVIGMILLFAEIHAADAFPGARIVADRIAIALITTFWGLAVAIPALSIYAVFRNRIDVLTAECALAAEHMLSVFKPGAAADAEADADAGEPTA
jgi:biopolymer transport protein ExbB